MFRKAPGKPLWSLCVTDMGTATSVSAAVGKVSRVAGTESSSPPRVRADGSVDMTKVEVVQSHERDMFSMGMTIIICILCANCKLYGYVPNKDTHVTMHIREYVLGHRATASTDLLEIGVTPLVVDMLNAMTHTDPTTRRSTVTRLEPRLNAAVCPLLPGPTRQGQRRGRDGIPDPNTRMSKRQR